MPFAARLAVAALLLSGGAAAAEHKIHGLTFETPEGWAEKLSTHGVMLSREYEVKGKKGATLIAIESRPFDGDFEAAFTSAARAIGDFGDKEPTVSRRGVTTTGHKMAWELMCCRNTERLPIEVTTVAFNPPGTLVTAHLILIRADDDKEEEGEAAFEALVAGLDFAGEGVRPALPTLMESEETLEGLYLHTSSGIVLNPMGGTEFQVNLNTLFFDTDGRLADQPPAGTDRLEEFCATHASSCGVYARKGDRIVMKTIADRFGMVEEESQSFARDGDALVIDDAVHSPIAPVRNLKLAGEWTYFWASTGQVGGSSTSVSSVRTLILSEDGRYTRSGFTSMISNVETGDTNTSVAGSSEKPEETGRYAIDGYTMRLMPDGGAEELMSIYLPDGGTDMLVIDGDSYLRKDRD